MEDPGVRNAATDPHLRAVTDTADVADICPAKTRRIGTTSLDALGHLKHTRELFWHYWSPVLAMLALISLESTELMSGEHTRRMLAKLMQWLGHPLSHRSLELLNFILRKTGHVIGYGLLCLSWLLLLRGTYWLRHEYQLCLKGGIPIRRLWWRPVWAALALLCTGAVAAADELHQMSIPGRTGMVRDMLLDICAALLAAALVWSRAQRHCRITQSGQGEQEQRQSSS